jgi:hypothetical protein
LLIRIGSSRSGNYIHGPFEPFWFQSADVGGLSDLILLPQRQPSEKSCEMEMVPREWEDIKTGHPPSPATSRSNSLVSITIGGQRQHGFHVHSDISSLLISPPATTCQDPTDCHRRSQACLEDATFLNLQIWHWHSHLAVVINHSFWCLVNAKILQCLTPHTLICAGALALSIEATRRLLRPIVATKFF